MKKFKDLLNTAKEHKWRLNPNLFQLFKVLEKENKDYEKLGKYYCPCKLEKIDSNVCVCKNAQDEIDKNGSCYCQMYFDNTALSIDINLMYENDESSVISIKGKEDVQFFYHISKKMRCITILYENNKISLYHTDDNKFYRKKNNDLILLKDLEISVNLIDKSMYSSKYVFDIMKLIASFYNEVINEKKIFTWEIPF
jgi:ferredoxin-thioredoxin reductase catalytic subunit